MKTISAFYPRDIKPEKFKGPESVQFGIALAVETFLQRAKIASRDAAEALRNYRNGGEWDHAEWLRRREARHNWILAARTILTTTTTGIATSNTQERRFQAAIRRASENQKAA